MDVKDLLKLVDAGFTPAQIEKLTGEPQAAPEEPAAPGGNGAAAAAAAGTAAAEICGCPAAGTAGGSAGVGRTENCRSAQCGDSG